jgi:hypothetical protein
MSIFSKDHPFKTRYNQTVLLHQIINLLFLKNKNYCTNYILKKNTRTNGHFAKDKAHRLHFGVKKPLQMILVRTITNNDHREREGGCVQTEEHLFRQYSLHSYKMVGAL